jgi:polynucleotide 5'-kinase involved in rRNA processing
MSEDLIELFKYANISPNEGEIENKQIITKKPEIADVKTEQHKDEFEEPIQYQDIMKEEFENSDVRIAMIGNVDSGKSTLIGIYKLA